MHIKHIINIICCFRDSWCVRMFSSFVCVVFFARTSIYQQTNTCKQLLLDVRKFAGIRESERNGAADFLVCTALCLHYPFLFLCIVGKRKLEYGTGYNLVYILIRNRNAWWSCPGNSGDTLVTWVYSFARSSLKCLKNVLMFWCDVDSSAKHIVNAHTQSHVKRC